MTIDLTDKTALVTGATGKLSQTLCRRLAHAGANLALHYHQNTETALGLQKSITDLNRRCHTYHFDLTDPQSPAQLAQAVLTDFPKIDILIHTASIFAFKSLRETDDHLWQTMFDLHVTSLYRLARALEDNFRNHPTTILTLADIYGLHPKSAFLAYSVSKGALISLTQALADEFAPTTTVNAIAPGIIDFPPGFPEPTRKKVLDRIPMHRTGTADEVADLALYLITNRYITGQTLVIDGGRTLT